MSNGSQPVLLPGPAGTLEVVLDSPEGEALGTAVLCHPHPLYGGSLSNKVVQTLARAFVQQGWKAVRFNFRGVGQSTGVYDEGRGELADAFAVVQSLAAQGPLSLAGFSFGAYVVAHAVQALHVSRDIHRVLMVGTAAGRFNVAPIAPGLHDKTLVVHGEQDDTVALGDVMDWARPQHLPVTVVPGAGHFFHGQLPLLKALAVRHIGY